MIMNPSVEIWKGAQRYSVSVARETNKAWCEWPSGVSKEIGLTTADLLIQMNGMKKITNPKG